MAKNSLLKGFQKGVNSIAPYALATAGVAAGLDYGIEGLEQLVQLPEVVEQGLFWGSLGSFAGLVLKPIYQDGVINFAKSIGNLVTKPVRGEINKVLRTVGRNDLAGRKDLLKYETKGQLTNRRNKWKNDVSRRHFLSAGSAGLAGLLLSQGVTGALSRRVEEGLEVISGLQCPDAKPSDYNNMYQNLEFKNNKWEGRASFEADLINKNKKAYLTVEKKTGVPWYVVGVIHLRESGGDFSTYLHNGEKLGKTTKIVPKGIYFDKWTDAAVDAIEKHYKPHEKHGTLEALERFNGLGYRDKVCDGESVQTPYLWSGSTDYNSGKFYADGKFSCKVTDKQVGTATILKALEEKGYVSKVKL